MSIAAASTDVEILAEVIAPERDDMSPDAARFVLQFVFSENQKEQMLDLADKNNRGELTEAERALMESYRRVGEALSIIHARARISLRHASENGR